MVGLFESGFYDVDNTFAYATLADVQRVTGLVRAKNLAARRFDEHIGFELEGIMRKAFIDDDLCVYGFLRENFESHKWRRK